MKWAGKVKNPNILHRNCHHVRQGTMSYRLYFATLLRTVLHNKMRGTSRAWKPWKVLIPCHDLPNVHWYIRLVHFFVYTFRCRSNELLAWEPPKKRKCIIQNMKQNKLCRMVRLSAKTTSLGNLHLKQKIWTAFQRSVSPAQPNHG